MPIWGSFKNTNEFSGFVEAPVRLKVVVVAAVVANASWSVELPPPRLYVFTLDCLSIYLKPWLKVVLKSSCGFTGLVPANYILSICKDVPLILLFV